MTDLRTRVHEALNNAFEGGYTELLKWTPLTVAEDLTNYAADLDIEDPLTLVPFVTEWQKEKRR